MSCTDSTATNYDPSANTDDGLCIAVRGGCTDSRAENYFGLYNFDDGSCAIVGCMDSNDPNYNPDATLDAGYFFCANQSPQQQPDPPTLRIAGAKEGAPKEHRREFRRIWTSLSTSSASPTC